jgi:hypothetical protein
VEKVKNESIREKNDKGKRRRKVKKKKRDGFHIYVAGFEKVALSKKKSGGIITNSGRRKVRE